MANEKILNTRIALKIDTLENWQKSTIGLLKGEIAIATVAATAGTGLTEPVCMIKIGEDGVKTFSQLDWNFYAKASDVLASAKSETALTDFINNVIKGSNFADNEAIAAITGRLDTAEDAIDAVEGAIEVLNGDADTAGSVAKAIKDAIAELEFANELDKKVDKVEGYSLVLDTEITKLAGVSEGANKVEKSTTNGNILVDGEEVVVYTHPDKHAIDDVTGLQAAIDDAKKAGTDAKAALDVYAEANDKALADETDAREAADEAILAVIGDVAEDTTVVEMIAAAQEAATYDDEEVRGLITAETARAEGIEAGLRTDVDAIKADYLKATDKTALTGLITAEAERAAEAEESLQAQINTIMSNPDAEGAINSINEFTQYVKDHGTIADGMRADINKNKEDIAANALGVTNLGTRMDTAEDAIEVLNGDAETEGSVAKAVKDAIDTIDNHSHENKTVLDGISEAKVAAWDAAEQNAKDYADGLDEVMAGRVKALEDVKDAYVAADEKVLKDAQDYADGLDTAMNTRVEALEAIDHDHANKAVLDGITADQVSAWGAAEQAAKDYADTEIAKLADGQVKTNKEAIEAINNTETGILAQAKAYADSLEHEDTKYTAAAEGGLTLNENNEFAIDDTITWVFNCGDAGVVAAE